MKTNIVDKLIKKIENKEINNEETLLEELNVISSLIQNVDEKLNGLKKMALDDKEDTGSYTRALALDTAIKFVEINLGDENE